MQILRSEAYFWVRRNDEECSATQHPDILRSRQILSMGVSTGHSPKCHILIPGHQVGFRVRVKIPNHPLPRRVGRCLSVLVRKYRQRFHRVCSRSHVRVKSLPYRRVILLVRYIDQIPAPLVGLSDVHIPAIRNNEARYASTALIETRFYTVVWTWRSGVRRIISFRTARDGEKKAYREIHGKGT